MPKNKRNNCNICNSCDICSCDTFSRGLYNTCNNVPVVQPIVQYISGPAGPAGQAGPSGSLGLTGASGSIGPSGSQGLQGIPGPSGAAGGGGTGTISGPIGPSGASGPAGAPAAGAVVPQYAFMYNNIGTITVPATANIPLLVNGPISTGITHTEGTTNIIITDPGIYEFIYTLSFRAPGQVALFRNNAFAIVPGSIYGSAASATTPATANIITEIVGTVITTVSAGDIFSLKNLTVGNPLINPTGTLVFTSPFGGIAANNSVSLSIKKIN